MKSKTKNAIYGYIYILPSFVLILVFYIIPIVMTFFFSFTKYRAIEAPVFVGLDNYIRLFNDPFTLAALKNTLIYSAIVVPCHVILPLIIAAVLAFKLQNRYGRLIKSVLYIPVVASMILCGVIWSSLLSAEPSGVVNTVIGWFGLGPVNWLGRTQTALLGVCIVAIWKSIGYFLVIYYAAMMDIPRSLYEAAEVDGAGKVQQFFFIVLPALKPVIFLVLTLGIIWSFQVFDLVYTMTAGGPGMATVTLVYLVYTSAFKEYNMGYASAVSVLLFVIVMVITILQKTLFREKSEEMQ